MNKVAISDMFEIQSSQLAQADADTKPFAEKIVQDHQKTSSELKVLVDGGKVKATLPTAFDSQHRRKSSSHSPGHVFRVGQRAARPSPERRPANSGERG